MQSIRLVELYELLLKGEASDADRDEFAALANDPRYEAQAKTLVLEALQNSTGKNKVDPTVSDGIFNAIVNAVAIDTRKRSNFTLHKINWIRYAAAIFLVVSSAAIAVYFLTNKKDKNPIAKNINNYLADFAAGGKKAMLTLADGRVIILDSSINGALAQQGNTEVIKLENGEIEYKKTGNVNGDEELINTMRTPRGGQYQLKLGDGTKVWLNSASSISYPAIFSGNTRKVNITGEVYLEVSPDPIRPFRVVINDSTEVEVLGTSFNINSYKDENEVATTLIEGKIRTSVNKKDGEKETVILHPGQQAVVTNYKKLQVNSNVNIDKIAAWKNGLFNFENATLEEVMRRISRWYDIEVVYERGIPQMSFGGEVSMNVSLAGLLNGLEKANVHFRIENGRRLIVMQ